MSTYLYTIEPTVWVAPHSLRPVGDQVPGIRVVGEQVVVSWKGDGLRKAFAVASAAVAEVGSPMFVYGTANDHENVLSLAPERPDVVAHVVRAMSKFHPDGPDVRRGGQRFNLVGRGRVGAKEGEVIGEVLEKKTTVLTHVWLPQLFPTSPRETDFALSGATSSDDSPAEFYARLKYCLPHLQMYLHSDNR